MDQVFDGLRSTVGGVHREMKEDLVRIFLNYNLAFLKDERVLLIILGAIERIFFQFFSKNMLIFKNFGKNDETMFQDKQKKQIDIIESTIKSLQNVK